MSEDIKGILLDKLPLNEMNTAFMRKLEQFGCVISMDEQGNDKYGKAQLALVKVMSEKKNPSVMVITKPKLMYAWYKAFITGIGADFKFITSDERSINHFAKGLANLYITNDEAGANPIFERIREAGLVWDMVIIDGALSSGGINTDGILEGFDFKTQLLAVFAPYIKAERDAAERLSEFPKKFLADAAKADYFKEHHPDESIVNFTLSTPFMRYYGRENLAPPKIKTVKYTVADDILKERAKLSRAPVYSSGGNIFEELTLDMRKVYIAEHYDDERVNLLREYDSKLNAYLTEVEKLLEDPDSRIITYFSSEKTLEYIYKILSSSLVGLGKVLYVRKSGLYGIDDTLRCFKASTENNIRIVLSLDNQDEECDAVEKITHVVNYELPDNPLTLHRRYKQGGYGGFEDLEFIIFRDETDQFDGRILCGSLALNFCDGFSYDIPGRNIYLFVDGLEKMLAEMICELEDIDKISDAELSKLIAKYNLQTTPDRAKLALSYGRDSVKMAFDISGEGTKAKIADIIAKKLAVFRESCCYLDLGGVLTAVKYDPAGSPEYAAYAEENAHGALVSLRDKARGALDACHNAADCMQLLHTADENDRSMVYYCAWRYLMEKHGLKHDYTEFLEAFYEELI